MPYIENVSLKAAQKGQHFNKGENSILIQIVNPGFGFPRTKEKFCSVYQFEVSDEDDLYSNKEGLFTTQQAAEITKALIDALDSNKNVTVHCHMGISRSGAVALVGSFIGFELRTNNQIANRRIQCFMERELFDNYQDYI